MHDEKKMNNLRSKIEIISAVFICITFVLQIVELEILVQAALCCCNLVLLIIMLVINVILKDIEEICFYAVVYILYSLLLTASAFNILYR